MFWHKRFVLQWRCYKLCSQCRQLQTVRAFDDVKTQIRPTSPEKIAFVMFVPSFCIGVNVSASVMSPNRPFYIQDSGQNMSAISATDVVFL